MAESTSEVTGAENALIALAGADASRTVAYIVNRSGVPMEVFLGTQTLAFETIQPSPRYKNSLSLTGDPCKSAIKGRTKGAPLAATVTLEP